MALALPSIPRARELMQALAVLDAILEPEWEYRWYSFDGDWGEGQEMGSVRNGQGDAWYCWFGAPGAAIVGHAHEFARPPGLGDDLPDAFREPVLEEPAFSADEATFLAWRTHDDAGWHGGGELDDLLEVVLADDPAAYVAWASDYHEVDVDQDAVAQIWGGAPLSGELVQSLNPELELDDLAEDLAQIGYPGA